MMAIPNESPTWDDIKKMSERELIDVLVEEGFPENSMEVFASK